MNTMDMDIDSGSFALIAGTDAKIECDPQLMEDSVFAMVRDTELEEEYHRARDRSYQIKDTEAREKAFAKLNREWFVQLELANPVVAALEEQPLILSRVSRCILAPGIRPKDESAELYYRQGEQPGSESAIGPCLVLRIRPVSFKRPWHIRILLRHELMHISDMLNPDFVYNPAISQFYDEKGVPNLIRDRYAVLWDSFIDGRLYRADQVDDNVRARRKSEFQKCFLVLGDDAPILFHKVFNANHLTHPQMVSFSKNPHTLLVHEFEEKTLAATQ